MGNARPILTESSGLRMSVRNKIIEILAEQAMIAPAEISADATLQDLAIDSLALVEVVFAIEESFDVSVPFNANEPSASGFDISSVNSIVAAVEGLLNAKEA